MNSMDFAYFRAKCLVKSVEKIGGNLICGLKHTIYIPADDRSC